MNRKIEFSIILPVLDEADIINQSLTKLRKYCSEEYVEIIVVDGDEAKGTISKVRVANIIKISSAMGRSRQMNAGAKLASSDILIFLHVDTELPENAMTEIRNVLMQKRAGAFDITFVGSRLLYKILSFVVLLRSRLTRIPYGDQAIFIKKEFFNKLGGFTDIPIMEDVDLMRRIKKRGDKIGFIRKRVKTSTRRWEAEGLLFTLTRNPILIFLFLCGVSAEKLVHYYKSGRSVYRTKIE